MLLFAKYRGISEALVSAYKDRDSLDKMLQARLQLRTNPNIKDYSEAAKALVVQAELEGWIEELVTVALYSRPDNIELNRVAQTVGLDSLIPTDEEMQVIDKHLNFERNQSSQMPLEDKVRELGFYTTDEWLQMIAIQEPRICRIEAPEGIPQGTGFLITEEHVLTNWHVFEPIKKKIDSGELTRDQIVFRFDYRKTNNGRKVSDGTTYNLSGGTQPIDSSPVNYDTKALPKPHELDYAVFKLDQPAGALPIAQHGKAEEGAPVRGYISLKFPSEKRDDNNIFVYQHPLGSSAKQAVGRFLFFNENETRVHHNANTLRGSSGSPCIDMADFELLAIHQASEHRSDNQTQNTIRPIKHGIPIHNILLSIQSQNNELWKFLYDLHVKDSKNS